MKKFAILMSLSVALVSSLAAESINLTFTPNTGSFSSTANGFTGSASGSNIKIASVSCVACSSSETTAVNGFINELLSFATGANFSGGSITLGGLTGGTFSGAFNPAGQFLSSVSATQIFGFNGPFTGSLTVNHNGTTTGSVTSGALNFNGPNGVPEPGTIFLLGAGLVGFGLFRRKAIA